MYLLELFKRHPSMPIDVTIVEHFVGLNPTKLFLAAEDRLEEEFSLLGYVIRDFPVWCEEQAFYMFLLENESNPETVLEIHCKITSKINTILEGEKNG